MSTLQSARPITVSRDVETSRSGRKAVHVRRHDYSWVSAKIISVDSGEVMQNKPTLNANSGCSATQENPLYSVDKKARRAEVVPSF